MLFPSCVVVTAPNRGGPLHGHLYHPFKDVIFYKWTTWLAQGASTYVTARINHKVWLCLSKTGLMAVYDSSVSHGALLAHTLHTHYIILRHGGCYIWRPFWKEPEQQLQQKVSSEFNIKQNKHHTLQHRRNVSVSLDKCFLSAAFSYRPSLFSVKAYMCNQSHVTLCPASANQKSV